MNEPPGSERSDTSFQNSVSVRRIGRRSVLPPGPGATRNNAPSAAAAINAAAAARRTGTESRVPIIEVLAQSRGLSLLSYASCAASALDRDVAVLPVEQFV